MSSCGRGVAGLLLWLTLGVAWAQTRAITILHTNDLHAKFLPNHEGRGGFANLATAIKREPCSACLVLHAGDFITGSPVSTIFKGVPVFEIANAMGFHASTIGNHEFDHGWQMVPEYVRASRFPLVLGNVVDGGGSQLVERGWQIFRVGGVRVAVVGGLTNDMVNLSTPPLMGDWRTTPLVETLRRQIAEVQPRADLVVLLLHVTAEEEDTLLRALPEAPLLVTGHVHRGLEQPKVYDGRMVVRVRAFGFELGRLDLQVDLARKSVASYKWTRIDIGGNRFPPDPRVQRLVARWESRVTRQVDVPIGESKRVYTRPELRVLFAQAMKEMVGSDFAFVNDGATRDELPRGRLTIRDIYNIMPFDNVVLTGTFPGAALPGLITEGLTIDPRKLYRFSIQDFTRWHQRHQLGLEQDLDFPEHGPLFRDLLIDWVRRKKVIE